MLVIVLKSVEENVQEVQLIPVTVTNEQDGGSSSLTVTKNKQGKKLLLTVQNM